MKDYLQVPEWESARSIYRKLSDEFNILTDAYSISLNKRRKQMLDHLILGIDEVDVVVDPLPNIQDREDLTSSILTYLSSDQDAWSHELATPSLISKIQVIKRIVKELGVEKRFHKAAFHIFKFTEEKRHTLNTDTLVQLVMQEGEATAELPLSIMQIEAEHPFVHFFTNLCRLMGVADLVMDARSDYKSNYIALKPNLKLYWKLHAIMVKEGLKLVWNFPHKIKFLLYCIRFSLLLFTTKD